MKLSENNIRRVIRHIIRENIGNDFVNVAVVGYGGRDDFGFDVYELSGPVDGFDDEAVYGVPTLMSWATDGDPNLDQVNHNDDWFQSAHRRMGEVLRMANRKHGTTHVYDTELMEFMPIEEYIALGATTE